MGTIEGNPKQKKPSEFRQFFWRVEKFLVDARSSVTRLNSIYKWYRLCALEFNSFSSNIKRIILYGHTFTRIRNTVYCNWYLARSIDPIRICYTICIRCKYIKKIIMRYVWLFQNNKIIICMLFKDELKNLQSAISNFLSFPGTQAMQ